MVQRCTNFDATSFKHYGGRGIGIHPQWTADFWAYHDYIENELGQAPSDGYSIDRIDNDGNYEPGNLRWATRSEQMTNTRASANKAPLTVCLIKMPAELADRFDKMVADRYTTRSALVREIMAREVETFNASRPGANGNGSDQDGAQ